MANISLKGEDILLRSGKSYFIIDALYLNDVKNGLTDVDTYDLENDIRRRIFPYTETPFAIIALDKIGDGLQAIEIDKIKKAGDEDVNPRCFSTDTGLIIILEKSIFLEFLTHFDYDKLVEGLSEPINLSYWTELEQQFAAYNCGLILSPGIKSGFDFDGSGLYKIEI